jgi:hypothetical protein
VTKSSAERWLRLKLGPDVRVIARPNDVRIVAERNGVQHVIGRGNTVDAALQTTLAAAADAVGAKPVALVVKAKVRGPWEAFRLALTTFWAAVRLVFAK